MISFGQTGLRLFPVGFGGIPLQRNTEQEAAEIVARAVEQGINFFDSARAYTDSEHKIGLGIKGRRDRVVLATKTMARTAAEMGADIEISLREFNTDFIELYQCHNVRTEEELQTLLAPKGGLESLALAQRAGKIGHIGITGHKPEVLRKALKEFPFAGVQFPYNYLEQDNKAELIGLARQLGLGIIIMKPLAGGAIREAEPALRFLLAQRLGVIIPGMDRLEQVEQNVSLAQDIRPLTPVETEALNKDIAGLGQDFCRRCEYCQPCPAGVNIPNMFLFEGYYSRYDLPQWAKERYEASAVKASACTKCGQCEDKCPYSLPIREKLEKVHALLG